MESCVGWWSFAGGLVQSGGELESCVRATVTLGVSCAPNFGAECTESLESWETGREGGGVWGVSNSSEVLAGLPKPDSLSDKEIY